MFLSLNDLINDSSFLEVDGKKSGYENHLVGSFHNGEQLAIKPHDAEMISGFDSFQQLADLKCQLANAYVGAYYQDMPASHQEQASVTLSDMWLNIQRDGDFNPVHNHNCKTMPGISCFVWLTFPDQVMETSRGAITGAEHRGMTYLHWGLTPATYARQFLYPKNAGLLPTPGAIIMFPNWLEHVVYPFRGPGKRISIASNIDVHLDNTQ